MDDVTRAALNSWNLRPLIIGILVLSGTLYTLGWMRLRRPKSRNGASKLAKRWRLFCYWAGLFLAFLALCSPIETLSGQLFYMHMIQHLIIAMLVPPLLLIANPLPFIMWGLPVSARRPLGQMLFTRHSVGRKVLMFVSQPALAWIAFFIFLWGWHDANMYNLTLRDEWAHDLEHFTFFWSAMFLWWHITGAAPVFHKRFGYPARAAFTLACVPANMILGVAIAMANSVIYTYYETLPFRVGNVSALTDQKIGGAIMWVPGSMMYVIAVIVLVTLWLREQEAEAKRTDALREAQRSAAA